MRRLVAMSVAAAVASSSVALAASLDCPTMRARALSRCCCPPGPAGQARLTCCATTAESATTANAREQTERPRLEPILAIVAHIQRSDVLSVAPVAPPRAVPASTTGPPLPLPLRV